jgi:hypothetical protein
MTVNENSTAYLTANLLDKNGDPAIPSGITYSIICLTNGTTVRAATAIAPGTSVEITLARSDNAIIDDTNDYEQRRVIIDATYGADDSLASYYDYLVKNLSVA